MLEVAYKNGGQVFGGYVRDFLVPKYKNKPTSNFKDIDIWFRSEENREKFITEMGNRIKSSERLDDLPEDLYDFKRRNLYLYSYGVPIASIDLIVDETIPVNDFNVNFLTYQNGNFKSYYYQSEDYLMDAIINKNIEITPKYYEKILSPNDRSHKHKTRVEKRYFERGWKIVLPDGTKWTKICEINLNPMSIMKNLHIYYEQIRDYTVAEINKVLEIVFSNGGKIFGQYVRDVIVPSKFSLPILTADSITFDVWFKKSEDLDKFVNIMGSDRLNSHIQFDDEESDPTRQRKYFYIAHVLKPIFIDLIISETYPCNDFDINYLTYDGDFESYNYQPKDFLIDSIKNKSTEISGEYLKVIFDEYKIFPNGSGKNFNLVTYEFLLRGWKIKLPDGEIFTRSTFSTLTEESLIKNMQIYDEKYVLLKI